MLRSKVAVFMALHQQARTIEDQNRLLAERLEERDRAQAALGRHAAELQRSNAELDRFAVGGRPRPAGAAARGGRPARAARRPPRRRPRRRRPAAGRPGPGPGRRPHRPHRRAAGRGPGQRRAPAAGADRPRPGPRPGPRRAGGPLLEEAAATVRSDPLPEVVGDEWLLGQVFSQLLDHAVRNGGRRSTPRSTWG